MVSVRFTYIKISEGIPCISSE
uniref:Uncharacterized protein n=1 Tax=Anguilla anguilla TaxID=7936 RepID=A0A0E9Q5I5_ANGAN